MVDFGIITEGPNRYIVVGMLDSVGVFLCKIDSDARKGG